MNCTNIIRFTFLALFLVTMFSCRKVFDKAKWEPEIAFPIAHTNLTIDQILTDTSQLSKDSTGFYSIVFKQKLDSISLDVLKPFTAPPFYRNFKLDSLRLEVPAFKQTLTLQQVIDQLKTSGNISNYILALNLEALDNKPLSDFQLFPGSSLPSILSFPIGYTPVSLNQFFRNATMRSGQLEITITNRLPMKVTGFDFSILNASDSTAIVSETGLDIDQNASFSKSYDLAGKTIDGNLIAYIPVLKLVTDKNAIIHLSDGLEVTIQFKNLQVESATAIFPDQDVVVDNQSPALENMGELELKEAIIEEGGLMMDVTSTIKDSIFITYRMPNATQNGVPLLFEAVVPPASETAATKITLEATLKEYTINLSSPPDYFNRFVYEFKAHVKNTGKIVNLNLKDSIEVNVYLSNVKPRYVRGYLGSLDTTISSLINTDVFDKIKALKIEPEQVKISLGIENGIGIGGKVQVKSLVGSNAAGTNVQASDPNFIGNDLAIAAAINPPFKSVFTLHKSSDASNFSQLVGILPNRLDYVIAAKIGGEPKDTNQFVFNTSKLKPELNIEMPLKIAVEGLILRDTLDIDPEELGIETNGGGLKLLAYNRFPFSATVKTTFYGDGIETIVLHGNQAMQAADVDPATGKVLAAKYSKIELFANADQLFAISKAKYLIIEARFDSPANQKVKIYSDYSAQLSLVGNAITKVSR